jgi:hypothetical protein
MAKFRATRDEVRSRIETLIEDIRHQRVAGGQA